MAEKNFKVDKKSALRIWTGENLGLRFSKVHVVGVRFYMLSPVSVPLAPASVPMRGYGVSSCVPACRACGDRDSFPPACGGKVVRR